MRIREQRGFMLKGKHILIIGARSGGYGESLAAAAVRAGAEVFGTTLNPDDPKEQEFFTQLGVKLLRTPLKFQFETRDETARALVSLQSELRDAGVERLHALIHTVAGGFPHQPSVMKAVGDILKGQAGFEDLATKVKRNVYYVNAMSFQTAAEGLGTLADNRTHLAALTYRGDMPYFIAPSKRYLERLAVRMARQGKRTVIAALPEAWTQSSQFFTGIELSVIQHYIRDLRGRSSVDPLVGDAYEEMERDLSELEGLSELLDEVERFLIERWSALDHSAQQAEAHELATEYFKHLRNEGTFSMLRRAVEIVSRFVREACGRIFVSAFLVNEAYSPSEVRQVYYADLLGTRDISVVPAAEYKPKAAALIRKWVSYDREDIRKVLNMYGDDFIFLDHVVMEAGTVEAGRPGFGSFVVPGPEESPILRNHFKDMPLFGGHLQMEAVAQFGTFMVIMIIGNPKLVPILTGTEFPNLNTMAPPGEKLSMMGRVYVPERRHLTLEAFIENRFARSYGVIRGMVIGRRVVEKMRASFNT